MSLIRRRRAGGAATGPSPASRRPLARSEDLTVEAVADELLVYDLTTHRAHALTATAAVVWRACDGKREVTDVSDELDLDEATVSQALEELHACRLLTSGPLSDGTTRRDLALRVAKVGAAAASVPLIWSIAAPTALAAATPTVDFCTNQGLSHGCGADCASRRCCCCCQQTDPNLRPNQCQGDNKCCLPTTQCEAKVWGLQSNCSNKAPCP